jgi:hypothetical protein
MVRGHEGKTQAAAVMCACSGPDLVAQVTWSIFVHSDGQDMQPGAIAVP